MNLFKIVQSNFALFFCSSIISTIFSLIAIALLLFIGIGFLKQMNYMNVSLGYVLCVLAIGFSICLSLTEVFYKYLNKKHSTEVVVSNDLEKLVWIFIAAGYILFIGTIVYIIISYSFQIEAPENIYAQSILISTTSIIGLFTVLYYHKQSKIQDKNTYSELIKKNKELEKRIKTLEDKLN